MIKLSSFSVEHGIELLGLRNRSWESIKDKSGCALVAKQINHNTHFDILDFQRFLVESY